MGSYARRVRQDAAARREIAHQPGALDAERLNAYRCPTCGKFTVTADVDDGTTPATLGCRATPGCTGMAYSLGYPDADRWPAAVPRTPGWEWYAPDAAAMQRVRHQGGAMWAHVSAGGLMIRRRTVGLR